MGAKWEMTREINEAISKYGLRVTLKNGRPLIEKRAGRRLNGMLMLTSSTSSLGSSSGPDTPSQSSETSNVESDSSGHLRETSKLRSAAHEVC